MKRRLFVCQGTYSRKSMFKCCEDQIDVLGVCVDEPLYVGGYSPIVFHAAYDGRKAIESMRQMRFDLLLVGSCLPDMASLALVQQARMMRVRPNWVMVGGPIKDQQKTMAIALGAVTFFETTPTTRELANLVGSLREQAMQYVLDGRFGQSAGYAQAA